MKYLRKLIRYTAGILIGLFIILFTLFIIGYLKFSGDYTVAETVTQDRSLPSIEVNGTRLHAEEFGKPSDRLIVVLHGGPGGDYRYLTSLRALAKDYHVVFYDQRGTGLSERVGADKISIDLYIGDLRAIIEHYGHGKKAILIGHSWGAMLATMFIARHPDMVSKVALAEPGILSNESAEEFLKIMMNLSSSQIWMVTKAWFKSLHAEGDDYAQEDFLVGEVMENPTRDSIFTGYFCNREVPDDALDFWRVGALAQKTIQGERMSKDNMQMNLTEGIENYPGKVLLIGSECSFIGYQWQKKYHAHLFPNLKFVEIKNSGHTMFSEVPKESSKILKDYFEE